MPPSVQWSWVAGSGAKVSPYFSAAPRSSSRMTPGCTRARRRPESSSRTRFRYFEKSITTATLQHCPARLVPQPRASTGTPKRRQIESAARTSSLSLGRTTPMGTWR